MDVLHKPGLQSQSDKETQEGPTGEQLQQLVETHGFPLALFLFKKQACFRTQVQGCISSTFTGATNGDRWRNGSLHIPASHNGLYMLSLWELEHGDRISPEPITSGCLSATEFPRLVIRPLLNLRWLVCCSRAFYPCVSFTTALVMCLPLHTKLLQRATSTPLFCSCA
jgi:hypothetical protein